MTASFASLGTTGMRISRIGFGAWAVGGEDWAFGWGPQDDGDSVATILRAVGEGVNWIDTAPAYGVGHSHEIVRRALAALPPADRPYVFTKTGLVWTDPDDRASSPRKVMREKEVRRDVERSLRQLDVERIDLLQAHWPGDGTLVGFEVDPDDPLAPSYATALEEYWELLATLRAEGKVRAIGLSNHDAAQLAAAEKITHVEVLQPPYSLLQRQAAAELAWCAEHGTGAIVYQPLHSGLLTGSFSHRRAQELAPNDWRRGTPEFTTHLDRNLALVDALRPVAERHGATVAAVAIAWTLATPGVTGAIAGARRPEQIAGWAGAGALELSGQDLADIAAALERTGAGEGPLPPAGTAG